MLKSPLLILPVLIGLISGCEFYLPTCGSDSTLEMLRAQSIKAFDLDSLAEFSMVTENASSLKERHRECQATIQPKTDFTARYNEAKRKIGGGHEDNVMGMIGRALVSAALPDRLGTVTIRYRIMRDEQSHGFGVEIDADSLDELSSLAKGYKLADIAIGRIIPEGNPSPGVPPASGNGNI